MRRIRPSILLAMLLILLVPKLALAFDHSHALFNSVLAKHVKDGLVNYKALKAAPQDLQKYVADIAKVKKEEFQSWSNAQQIALLINLYNAKILQIIINNYPVSTINNIGSLLEAPWQVEDVELFQEKVSLEFIQKEMLRKDYQRPEIHFALVRASKSCPALRSEAYIAEKLDQQLEEQGKMFLADTNKNRVDDVRQRVVLSSIFKWFAEDFEKKSDTIIEFVKLYLPEEEAKKITAFWSIKYLDYDWLLNEQQS